MHTDPLAHVRTLLTQGNQAGAEETLRRLIAQPVRSAPAHALLGNLLRRQSRFAEARQELLRAVEIDPRLAQAWKDLTLAAVGERTYEAADTASRRALDLLPHDAWTHVLRGHVLALCSRYGEADEHFALAAKAVPATGEARVDLALEAVAHQQARTARYHAANAVQAQPKSARAWAAMGEACLISGETHEATHALRHALDLAPRDVPLKRRFAQLLERSKHDLDTLVRLRRELLGLEPESAQATARLGRALIMARRWSEMHEVFARQRELCARLDEKEPGDLLARWVGFLIPPSEVYPDMAAMQAFRQRWCEGIAWFEELAIDQAGVIAQLPTLLNSVSNFFLAYTGEADVPLHRRYAGVVRRLVRAVSPQANQEIVRQPITNRKRRIGVLSTHFHAGSVSRAWGEALLAIPDDDLELHVFSTGSTIDESAARLRARATAFHAEPRNFDEWCATLRSADLDVLIFLAVGMDAAVQALATLRHAAVQVATWGHPVTTGMPAIDYFLSADLAEPEEAACHYSERLVRLPNLGGCFALPTTPVAAPRVPDCRARFICIQTLAKLHPGHDTLFARILQACPESTLTLLTQASNHAELEALRTRLAPALQDHDVEAGRVRVLPMLDHASYLSELASCDVVLDSLGFSGGLTSLDSFWHEKPVVTLPGPLMRGRQTMAMLRRMDMPELIARDEGEYVRIAAELVASTQHYRHITQLLAERKLRLFDDREVTAALKLFLRTVQPPPTVSALPATLAAP